MQTLPITELRQLLASVSGNGQTHLLEVESDLQQTAYLLKTAIEKLGDSFADINHCLTEQQALLDELMTHQAFKQDAAIVEKLNALKEKVSVDVNEVVTSMQFQDMTDQLLSRSLKRVGGLKDLMNGLGNHGDADGVCKVSSDEGEIMDYIHAVKDQIDEKSLALAGVLQKRAVAQKNMSTGEVELF